MLKCQHRARGLPVKEWLPFDRSVGRQVANFNHTRLSWIGAHCVTAPTWSPRWGLAAARRRLLPCAQLTARYPLALCCSAAHELHGFPTVVSLAAVWKPQFLLWARPTRFVLFLNTTRDGLNTILGRALRAMR